MISLSFFRIPGGIEPTFFRKPSSRQEGTKLHLECEIEALPRPEIKWYRNDEELFQSDKYQFYRAIQPSNPNIHFVRLTIVVSNSTNVRHVTFKFSHAFFYERQCKKNAI